MEASGNQQSEGTQKDGKVNTKDKQNTDLTDPSTNSLNQKSSNSSVGQKSTNESQPDGENVSSKVPTPSRTLYYPSLEKCVTLETDLQVLFFSIRKFH